MARKQKPEEIIGKLREAEIVLAQGGTVADAFAWDSYSACLEETLSDQWEDLVAAGYYADEQFEAMPYETASGQFEFSNREVGALPAYAPLAPEGDASTFPDDPRRLSDDARRLPDDENWLYCDVRRL